MKIDTQCKECASWLRDIDLKTDVQFKINAERSSAEACAETQTIVCPICGNEIHLGNVVFREYANFKEWFDVRGIHDFRNQIYNDFSGQQSLVSFISNSIGMFSINRMDNMNVVDHIICNYLHCPPPIYADYRRNWKKRMRLVIHDAIGDIHHSKLNKYEFVFDEIQHEKDNQLTQ